jgi:hypothetical protein
MCDRRVPITLLLVGVSVVILSCKTEMITPSDIVLQKNIPVLVIAQDVVTFAIDANRFSFERSDPTTFQADSLVLTLAVSGFATGTGQLTVSGPTGVAVYAVNLASNQVAVLTDLRGWAPRTFSVRLTDYTGSVSFVLSKKK